MNNTLDHLVVAAADLDAGVAFMEDKLRVPFAPGGRHQGMGTHNALLSLGNSCYLEVIAPDPLAPQPPRKPWFSLDDPQLLTELRKKPRLLHWVVRTNDIVAWAARSREPLGPVCDMRRGDLEWHITIPEDGHLPAQGIVPSLIQWPGPSPATRLPDRGCRLKSLTATHPDPRYIHSALKSLDIQEFLKVAEGSKIGLSAEIDGPAGRVQIF